MAQQAHGDSVPLDRHPSFRERMVGLRGGSVLLLIVGILAAPLVTTGYVGLAVLLFLPLLALRRVFAGARNGWDVATGRV